MEKHTTEQAVKAEDVSKNIRPKKSERRYYPFEKDPYNKYQNFLYNRALKGLSVYSEEELKTMSYDKRNRIRRVHKRAQHVLNIWKQEIVNKMTNNFFTDIFPDTEFTKMLTNKYGNTTDPRFINTLSFKLLKISKVQIIDKLISERVLPRDFKTLKNP